MKTYSEKLSLIKNGRGVWSLDTVMGCSYGMSLGKYGCYNDCYAARAAHRYGYDFSKPVNRVFLDKNHFEKIFHAINRCDMQFIRVGTSGDPSCDWRHTINILKAFRACKKEFVIITKHWETIPNDLLSDLAELDLTINTSVSALDADSDVDRCLIEYERLKNYCNSVLRVVTCDFNTYNPVGWKLATKQDKLIAITPDYLDTVFRPSINNELVVKKVINTSEHKFIKSKVLVSKLNSSTYLNKCGTCPDMCGAKKHTEQHPQKQYKILFDMGVL